VTDPIARLKNMSTPYGAGLSYSDLSLEEQRLVRIGAASAAILLWFAVALVQPWLVFAIPALGAGLVWLISRRRAAQPDRADDHDDWSY
jgi:hypothetical protein